MIPKGRRGWQEAGTKFNICLILQRGLDRWSDLIFDTTHIIGHEAKMDYVLIETYNEKFS